jgi:hypothetical protein
MKAVFRADGSLSSHHVPSIEVQSRNTPFVQAQKRRVHILTFVRMAGTPSCVGRRPSPRLGYLPSGVNFQIDPRKPTATAMTLPSGVHAM